MRILWLCHFLPYPATGHGALQRTHRLLVDTAKLHDVGLIALVPGPVNGPRKLISEAKSDLGTSLAFIDTVEVPDGWHGLLRKLSMVRGVASGRTYWEHWFQRGAVAHALRRRITDFRPDVVHLDSALLGSYLGMLDMKRTVVTHHNIESDLYAERATVAAFPVGPLLAREARKLAHFERNVAEAVALNIMVSDSDAARLKTVAPRSVTTVVPNGVDTEYFRASPETLPVSGSLVFVGGMDWYPNALAMEWFSSAVWPVLAADDPKRRLTVVGRRPPAAVVELAAADDRVTVAGFVPDVRPYIDAASIYVCPIKVGGGTRLKILDALSMAKPIVSTALGVSGLGLEEGTHYIGAETPADFARQISRLDNDPELRIALGMNARRLVEERYAWPGISARLHAKLDRFGHDTCQKA